ncbi:hypothetical protein [Streptomyces sp. SP18BB07]|uniref:hypothetical protein n=1 Tax=Streptomyces sp. SP18BB07 TaxID=3002522 RepID=UPI003FCD2FB3
MTTQHTSTGGKRMGAVGAVGAVRAVGSSSCGTADLNIVLRTAVLTEEGPHAGAGGAVVLDPQLVEEHEEMLLKAATSPRVPLAATSGQDATPPTGGTVRTRAAEGGLR